MVVLYRADTRGRRAAGSGLVVECRCGAVLCTPAHSDDWSERYLEVPGGTRPTADDTAVPGPRRAVNTLWYVLAKVMGPAAPTCPRRPHRPHRPRHPRRAHKAFTAHDSRPALPRA